MKGFNNMDIYDIIEKSKQSFTRDRKSIIKDFLTSHDVKNTVILSHLHKSRGDSIKFHYIEKGVVRNTDVVLKNAQVLIDALQNEGVNLYTLEDGNIKEYNGTI